MSVRIAPSILAADFGSLASEIERCNAGGADWIHIDVMDGRFVPNLTFGRKVIETVRALTTLPLDVHLMVADPSTYVDGFAKAGANGLTIHAEATLHLQGELAHIRSLGCQAGVALNPGTPLDAVSEVLDDVDVLLIMTVNPGFGAQRFIPHSLEKIRRARAMLTATNCPATLEVDGGINRTTIADVWRAGADTFVAGTAVFGAPDPIAEIGALRDRCRPSA